MWTKRHLSGAWSRCMKCCVAAPLCRGGRENTATERRGYKRAEASCISAIIRSVMANTGGKLSRGSSFNLNASVQSVPSRLGRFPGPPIGRTHPVASSIILASSRCRCRPGSRQAHIQAQDRHLRPPRQPQHPSGTVGDALLQ